MAKDCWEWSCDVVEADKLRLYKDTIVHNDKTKIVLQRNASKHSQCAIYLTRENAEDLVSRLQEVLAGPLGKLVLDLERRR